MATHHSAPHQFGTHEASSAEIAMIDMLETDAQVMSSYLADLTGWIAEAADSTPARILDLGSGPGTGTFVLAREFPGASVTAMDSSAQMLHWLERQAGAHGVSDRVHPVRADLDRQWPIPVVAAENDLIWAAAFLHHLIDPDRGLSQAFQSLRPGGLIAVTEMDFFPRLLPDDAGIGQPGLETRLHAATNTQPSHEWSDHLRRAGFILESRRPLEIRIDRSSGGPVLNRYAQLVLAKLRSHAAGSLSPDDLDAWDTLLLDTHPRSVSQRRDLVLRTTRTTWVARRPY